MKQDDPHAYPPRLMRAEQAARYVDVSRSAFLRLVEEGIFPKPVKIRGVVCWDRHELDDAVEDLKSRRASDEQMAKFFTGD